MIGEKLGPYHLTAKIGEGGMGVVYRARDEELNREVAVKVLAAGMLDQLGRDHLLREAQTASALNHPNICTIYQIGHLADGCYLVMELVEGQPLSEMTHGAKLTTEAVTRYGVQIADALAHAHDRQIIHRDLKGANVVITPDGRVKVLDFGLARRLDRATVDALTRSQASVERDRVVVGTLPYMAPEILTGETGSYQSDIWALGVLLYEAVTGQWPFGGSTPYGLGAAILHELPRPLPPSVPPGLSAVILRCLAKDLKDRFQRAGEIRSALETIQAAAIVSQPRREEPAGPRTLVLRGIRHLDVKNGDVLLLLGTTKGAFLPERFPQFGQCVHKIVRHPDRPDRLFLQNHWGLYRSDDGADSWNDIAHGLPSDFGFAMATHPHDPDCVYIVPMDSDEFRCTPEGRLRVYRTRSAGASWEPLTRGLPQQGAYETVLRDGMVTDSLDPVGVYFGTRSGKLYASRDAGKTWKELLSGLPQIVCVAIAVVAELAGAATPKPADKRRRASAKDAKGSVAKRKGTRTADVQSRKRERRSGGRKRSHR